MSFFPVAASELASQVDWLTIALLVFCGLILLLVCGLIIFLGIRYRDGSKADRRAPPLSGVPLELAWSSALVAIALSIFAAGAWLFFHEHRVPAGATDVYVVGKQWMWKFQHADGRRELGELHVPAGQKIRLVMTSQDVIHSLFLPAMRLKQDVLPDRYTYQWFEANRPGTYPIFCTQYCGTDHSAMTATLYVMTPEEFSRWQRAGVSGTPSLSAESMVSRGAEHFRRLGCVSCHAEASAVTAPRLQGVYGSQVGLRTGASVFADENYIRESILNPSAKIVQGYPDIMPSFEGKVSEEELLELIAFVKSFGESVK